MNSPVDIKELLEIMDNDEELLRECFDDFVTDSGEMLDAIKVAINTDNPDALEKTAHAFKGSLKYLAALQAAKIALQLEDMGRTGRMSDAENTLKRLMAESDRVIEFIKSY